MNKKFEYLVSKEDCELILTRHFNNNNFKLLTYSLRPLSDEHEGFLGEHYLLEIEVQHQNEVTTLNLFTKFQPMSFELQLEFCKYSAAFESEICFYEQIIPELKKYHEKFDDSIVPKYFFSKGNTLVVLENCAIRDFRLADTDDVFTIDHIKLVLKAFAKLHAASIIYEEKKSKEMNKRYRLTDDYEEYLQETFFRNDEQYLGYQWSKSSEKCNLQIIDLMAEEGLSRDQFKKKYSELVSTCFEIAKLSKQYRNVCCHGDMIRKNVLFKYENDIPIDCVLVDFQLMKYNPPAYDFLKFIYQITSPEMRHHYFDDLKSFFYEHLCYELKLGGVKSEEVLPYDEFQASIKYVLPYTKIEAANYYHFQRIDKEYLNKISNDKEAYKTYMFKNRLDLLDTYYKEGSYFKTWMDGILLEIKDLVMNDNFSTEDCRTVVKNTLNSTDYELIKYEICLLQEQNGFLGMHKEMKTIIKRDNKQQILKYFAKFFPATKFSEYALTSGAFDNEVFVYDHVFKAMNNLQININNCVSKCFFTRKNDVLVFEDLRETGYHAVNKHEPFNYNQVRVIISTLAQYHAACFTLEEKLSAYHKKPFRIIDEYKKLRDVCYVKKNNHKAGKLALESLIKGFHTQIDLFPDTKSKISDEELKKYVEKIFTELMFDYSEPSNKYRNVICHGDLWASNIMLKYDEFGIPTHAKLVDFQCVKKCPPAQDVMAFIYLTTSRKFRAQHMDEILKYYHQQLEKHLHDYNINIDNILPYDEYLESCDYFKVFAISQAVTHFQFVMVSAEDMLDLFNNDKLCHKTMYVDRSEFITKMCAQDAQYKFFLEESLIDFRAMCEMINI